MKRYTEFNQTPYEAHSIIYSLVSPKSKVLDVGCATGYFASELIRKKCMTWGVEFDQEAAQEARKYCKEVYVCDLNGSGKFPFPQKFFDYVLLLDVLEHLLEPEKTLELVKKYLKDEGVMIVSIPNAAHFSVRFNIFFGRFDYQDKGFMDRSHVRFFTKRSLLAMLNQTQFSIKELCYSSDFGQIPVMGRLLRHVPKRLQQQFTTMLDTLLAVQFIAVCRK